MQWAANPRAKAALRLALEVFILIAAYMAYEVVRRLVAPSSHEAFGHAFNIIAFEQRLGFFPEPELQRYILDHHWLVTLFNWIYVWGYLPVISVCALYLYARHRQFYTRYRNAFLLSGAVGLVIFSLAPVAPPRMFPEFGFVDTVHLHSTVYRSIHDSDLVNEFAAVPSFHFGWILLVSLAIFQANRHVVVRAFAVGMPLLMLSAIVLTANHYWIDAAIGGAIVLGALAAVRGGEWAWRKRAQQRRVVSRARLR